MANAFKHILSRALNRPPQKEIHVYVSNIDILRFRKIKNILVSPGRRFSHRRFNRKYERSGTLWEERFKSVIVEGGAAARTIAAYIDLNPVRAGMVSDPADYRWSSYGEAVGGGKKGNGKKVREGLVRACMSRSGKGFEAECWKEASRIYRRAMGLALSRKSGRAAVGTPGHTTKNERRR